MRALRRNQTPIWYANFDRLEATKDEYSNETGYKTILNDPVQMYANVSPAKGETETRIFGEDIGYDKVVVFAGKSPVTETSVFWIDNLVGGEIPQENGKNVSHDYTVRKVAQSLNSTSLAVQKVNVSTVAFAITEPPTVNLWNDSETWNDFEIWED